MLVFEVEVERWITQVYFVAVALVARSLPACPGLTPSSFFCLGVVLIVGGFVATHWWMGL